MLIHLLNRCESKVQLFVNRLSVKNQDGWQWRRMNGTRFGRGLWRRWNTGKRILPRREPRQTRRCARHFNVVVAVAANLLFWKSFLWPRFGSSAFPPVPGHEEKETFRMWDEKASLEILKSICAESRGVHPWFKGNSVSSSASIQNSFTIRKE